jgi:hypothetical protein
MKVFLWSVLACFVISAGAAVILTSLEDSPSSTRVSDSVRLD